MGGYDMGAWDESTKKPTVMMDAFLGVKHTEVSWLMKAKMTAPQQDQDVVDALTLKADVKHIRNRTQSVAFYLDKRLKGTVTESPYALTVDGVEPGLHTVWVKATDSEKNTQMSDTVTFMTGESALMDEPVVTDGTLEGGSACWSLSLNTLGRYRLLFKYTSTNICGTDVWVNADSIGRIYFTKKEDDYQKRDIEIHESGQLTLSLRATGKYGLPDIKWLRIFPLDGQTPPSPRDQTAINRLRIGSDDEMVDVFNLSGVFIRSVKQSQLGVSLGDRSSAVVWPNKVGGTPCIVRKRRHKDAFFD